MSRDRADDPNRAARSAVRRRIENYARLLDSAIGIPGTRFRVGVDALIGLIPGVGDFAGLLLGGALVGEAIRLRAPRRLLARMLGNIALDAALGAIPALGDVFDFVFRANQRNARLLLDHLDALNAADAGPFAEEPLRRARRLLPAIVVITLLAGLAGAIAWLL